MAVREIPDKVFLNGKIVTLDQSNTIASGVAVKNGRIAAVGEDKEIRTMSDETTASSL